MALVDLHVHTNKSPCGLHSLLEILALARERGLALVAITDHDTGAGHGTRVLSYRFPDEWAGVRVLKGIEFSIRDGGALHIPALVRVEALDVCLAGFHAETRTVRDDVVRCTDDLASCLERYPCVDILTHPTIQGFPLDPVRCADLLARHGVAVEVNNCALQYGKEREENLLLLLRECRRAGVWVAANSDTHAAPELGRLERAQALIERAGIPSDRVLTSSVDRVLAFVEQRRSRKRGMAAAG